MTVSKILWPTDFSGSAEKAMPQVLSLSEKFQAEIHVLFVIEDLAHHAAWYGEFEKERAEKISDFSLKTARKKLDRICEKYLDGCPLYVRHVAIGDPAREILNLVEQEKIDMVVMASRGAKGHFSFGSVAEKVVKHATVPVVTVPVAAPG